MKKALISEYMASLGRKGRGAAKKRGSSAYYRKIALLRYAFQDKVDKKAIA
jgi:hypothetical protein